MAGEERGVEQETPSRLRPEVTIRFLTPIDRIDNEAPRRTSGEAFWGYIREVGQGWEGPRRQDQIEDRIRAEFDSSLRQQMSNWLDRPVSGVLFKISRIRYGSLELTAAVVGATKLAEYFEFSADDFLDFLEAYSGRALNNCVGTTNISYAVEVKANPTLRQAFGTAAAQSSPTVNQIEATAAGAAQEPPGKAIRVAQILAGNSSVLFILVACFVLYIVFAAAMEMHRANADFAIKLQEQSIRLLDEQRVEQADNKRSQDAIMSYIIKTKFPDSNAPATKPATPPHIGPKQGHKP